MGRRGVTEPGSGESGGRTESGDRRPEPADGADPTRCGCAGKTPLSRVVLPARDRVAAALAGTDVELGDDADAAVLRAGDLDRGTDLVALGEGDAPSPSGGRDVEANTDGGPAVVLACAFLGDGMADPDRLGAALSAAYASFDGSPTRIGKGHAVQVPNATGGRLWLERFAPVVGGDDRATDGDAEGVVALNVDAVNAFPALAPGEQARIASLNALNDAHAVGATDRRTVRPVVATPDGESPDPARVAEWYAAGTPTDVTVLAPSVLDHGGDGWLIGAGVTARDRTVFERRPLPDDCGVLLTRPLGGLACFAHGVAVGDDGLHDRGLAHLRRDGRPVARALSTFRPDPGEPFDPQRHVVRVTDVSGEGVAGLGRVAAAAGRALRIRRLPLLPGAAAAAEAWTVPDATVETNGPLAVFADPGVLRDVTDRITSIRDAEPCRLGSLTRPGGGAASDGAVVDATDAGLSNAIESAARWPRRDRGGGAADGASRGDGR